jgi:uncharacterized glyoxalase superfamily protein PhnB
MQLAAHLNFNRNCEAAFKFYAETLGGKNHIHHEAGRVSDGG